jgi:hypothetical protein
MTTRLLLLASDATLPDELVRLLEQRCREGAVEARLLLPVRPRPDAWEWDEDATRSQTISLLDAALTRLRGTGAQVEGTVGCDRDPMVCVNWVMEREPFDEVIVVHPGRARRLKLDLAARIRRAFDIPVTRVAARPAAHAA